MKCEISNADTITLLPECDADYALLGKWCEQVARISGSSYADGQTHSLCIMFDQIKNTGVGVTDNQEVERGKFFEALYRTDYEHDETILINVNYPCPLCLHGKVSIYHKYNKSYNNNHVVSWNCKRCGEHVIDCRAYDKLVG